MFRRFLGPPSRDGAEPPRDAGRGTPDEIGDTATVRRIVARLEALPPEQARYLASFAYVMSRAAQADLDISDAETRVMEQSLVELGGLDEAQAVLVVEMAKLQARMQGATEDFLVTREFARMATEQQKLALLRCCFAVGAADDSISADEASIVNEIARELDVTREQLNAVREEFVERLSAIQAMRRMARGES
ncbi:MAG TPA: TerB family tellurite resistance protein [Candidatus Limnocylindrales bacterium]|nr:TerB family tellurite resistance protein [Candidatus Limnocylindrales bacterium]